MGNRESSLQDHHCAFYSESHPNPENLSFGNWLSPFCYLAAMITLPGLLLCNPNSRQGVTINMVAINTRSSVFNFCKLAVTLKITQRGPLLCNPDFRQGVTNAGKKQCKSAADSGNGVSNQPVRERRKIAASKENPTFLDPDHCGYRRYHMIL